MNVQIGILGTKLPENKDLQVISFRSSLDCISKILAIKDKLTYLIISQTLAKSVVPLIHQHRCIEHIYMLHNLDDQRQVDWIKNYSNICTSKSSIESIVELIMQNIESLMQRPSRWLRSKSLLSQLSVQTSETNLWALIEDVPKEHISMTRIITLFFGSHQLFSRSQSQIQIDEFNDVDQCMRSIQAQSSTAVLLIILTDGSDDMHFLFELDAIHAVYIVPKDNNNEQIEIRSQHPKVSGIFGLDKDLLKQLIADICFYRHMRFAMPMINIFDLEANFIDNGDSQLINFLFFQLFSDILPHIPAIQSTEIDNLSIARITEANITINHLFNQFDRSTLEKSIPQLKKIFQCITSLSQTVDSSSTTIYRAQLLSRKDFETMQNSTNALVSIPNFVLASTSFRNVVAICRRAIDSQLTVVLFKFNLSEHVTWTQLDSDIVVISPTTVFRLISMERGVDGVWHVHLESVTGVMARIKDELQPKMGGHLTWLTFGNYLSYLDQSDSAKEYYHYLVSVLPGNHSSLVSIYNNMGLIYSAMNDAEEALKWLTKALSSTSTNPSAVAVEDMATTLNMTASQDLSDNPGPILGKLAEISYQLGDQIKARDFYRRAYELTSDVNLRNFYQEKILALSFLNNNE